MNKFGTAFWQRRLRTKTEDSLLGEEAKIPVITSILILVLLKKTPTQQTSKQKSTYFKVIEEPNLNCLSNCLQSPITIVNNRILLLQEKVVDFLKIAGVKLNTIKERGGKSFKDKY